MFDLLSIIIFSLIIVVSLIVSLYFEKDWSTPIFLVLAWLLIFIVGDAWYSYIVNNYGPGEYHRYLLQNNQMGFVINVWSIATVFMITGYIFTIKSAPVFKKKSIYNKRYEQIIKSSYQSSIIVTIINLLFTFVALVFIATQAMQLGYVLSEVSQLRNQLFSDGGGYLLIFVQLFKYSILFWIFYYIQLAKNANKKVNIIVIFLTVLLALLIDLFLGTRSSFVYGFLLPLLIIVHKEYKKIQLKNILYIGIFIFVFVGIIYRTIARDQHFIANRGGDLGDLIMLNLKEAPRFFWGGFEASSLDGLIDIIDKIKFSSDYFLGKTIIDGLTAPIPRFLFEEKARGGANYVYTSTYYPEFYGAIRSEYSASFIGELYLNGGIFLIVIGFLFLGVFLAVLKIITQKYSNTVLLIFYGVVISRIYSLLRGDVFNFSAQLFISVITLIMIYLMIVIIRKINFSKSV